MTLTGLLLVVFVWIEVTQSRDELLDLVNTEAATLIETLNQGSEMTLLTTQELEQTLLDKLIVSARLIDHIGGHTVIDDEILAREILVSDLDAVLVFDRRGTLVSGSTRNRGSIRKYDALLDSLVEPVIGGEVAWNSNAAMPLAILGDTLFILANVRERGGAVVVGVRSSTMLALRKRLGIGRLVQEIGGNPNIAFVVLQDEQGIITASKGVAGMASIGEDEFLRTAMETGRASSRIIDYEGIKVLEVVKVLRMSEREPIISRIGLSLTGVREIQQRSMRRVLLLAGGLFLSIVLVSIFLMTRARLNLLNIEHRKIRSSTDTILDNIADAVVAIDAQGTITAVNSAAIELLFLRDQKITGRLYDDIFPDDAILLRESSRHGPVEYREVTVRGDGASNLLAVSTSAVRNDNGAPDIFIAIARDLTEHRRALEQLQRKDKLTAMGELAGGIAHEIRNPLNAIGIIAQRFQKEFTPTEDAEEYRVLADTIRSEVLRVNTIIAQFLEFSRPPKPVLESVDLDVLLDESVQTVRSQARERNIGIVVISDTHVTILGDKGRWKQALLNLLQNAIEAIEKDGMIKCVLCRVEQQAILTIADTGPGIPDDVRERMFNLYFTTKSGGSGMGLSIVHQIVSEHGGDISVAGQVGIGATFNIRIPITSGEPV